MTKEFFEKGKKIAKWADNNMTKDEALKMAIKELSQIALGDTPALKACKEALEQPVVMERDYNFMRDLAIGCEDAWNELHKQEPVAVITPDNYGEPRLDFIVTFKYKATTAVNPDIFLYIHPAPSWQGLSDEEILEIDKSIDPKISIGKGKTLFARAIEQELKTKNGFSGLKEKNNV